LDVTILEDPAEGSPRLRRARHPLLGVLSACVAAILMAVFWLFIAKAQHAGTPPSAVGFFAHIVCFLLAAVSLGTTGRWRILVHVWRTKRLLFVSIGVLSAILSLLSVVGLPMSNLGSLGVLSSTDILFTLVFGWLFFHERLRRSSLLAVIVILLGATVRIIGGQAEVLRETKAATSALSEGALAAAPDEVVISNAHARRLTGDLFFLTYAVLMSLNAFFIKRLLGHASMDVILFGNYAMRMIGYGIVGLFSGGLARGWALMAGDGYVLAMVLMAGLSITAQMSVYYLTLSMVPVWVTKTFMMAGPMLYFVVDWLAFGRPPTTDTLIGAAMVLGGAVYVLLTDPLFHPERRKA